MKTYILKHTEAASTQAARYTLDYEAELNASQYEVVTSFEGPILVVAGAGSGKTRTLTYRVARMVESGIRPESILLLTFTRKSAQEMLRRAAALLDSRCERVAGGTFHSFANLTLRRHAKALGFQQGFTILDQADSEDVVGLLRDQFGLNKKDRRFPNKRTAHAMFSKAVNKSLPLQQVIEQSYAQYCDDADDLQALFRAYAQYKFTHRFMDYDDLLVYTAQLLEQHPSIRERLSDGYRYIMVDEYQDTNKIQAKIVHALASTHHNVMAVGDEAQSIYSFRGAHYRNIIEFPTQFPGTRIIKLEENYRSVQPILDLTNAIITQAQDSFRKTLFTSKQGGELPALVAASDEHEQSQFVAQRIVELREDGVPLDEIAVLFRSSYHSFDLELELNKRNIPFVKVGGFKFIEAAHIKDMLAYLRVLVNPLDAISWTRLLTLVEKIGPKTSSKIIAQLQHETEENRDPLDYLAGYPGKAKYAEALQGLGGVLASIRPLRPVEQVHNLLEYYLPIMREKYDRVEKREQDLEQLGQITERFDNLPDFLAEVTLEPPNQSVDDVMQTTTEEEYLTLSTIHSAKGLEWHSVFVIWLLDGRFPSVYAANDDESLQEELRLLYVAATRAMTNLYLTYPVYYDSRAGMLFSRPSRFLDTVPDEYLEHWSLRAEKTRHWEDWT